MKTFKATIRFSDKSDHTVIGTMAQIEAYIADYSDEYLVYTTTYFVEPVPEVKPVKPVKPAKPVYRIAGKFCTKQAFVAYVHGRLAILEALVTQLNIDLLKDIPSKTFDAVLACLRKLYAAIDGLTAELARLDTV